MKILVGNCDACEVLKFQLAKVEAERDRLLNYILEKPSESLPQQNEVNRVGQKEEEPVVPKFVPWNVRRQMLETEDREKAKLIAKQKKEQQEAIQALEKELKLDQPVNMMGRVEASDV